MGDHSKIEWTDASWNPVRARNLATGGVGHFCVHASEGCRNCYAERLQPRFENPIRFAAQDRDRVEIFLDATMLTQPLRWKRPRRIFVGSMTDLFADFVTDDMLDRIFAVMALCPQHIFQLLTKRPARMRDYLVDRSSLRSTGRGNAVTELARAYHPDPDSIYLELLQLPPSNVWLGVSVEDQATADERIPLLLLTPAMVKFVSYEPALGPVDFAAIDDERLLGYKLNALKGQAWPSEALLDCGVEPLVGGSRLDWIICGGESGPGARPMHPDWARSVRDQCAAAEVPFFFKQWGEWAPDPNDPDDTYEKHRARGGRDSIVMKPEFIGMELVGKKRAGRTLDGREHNDLPTVRA